MIARIGDLGMLNGSIVREREREDAEKLYVKRCLSIKEGGYVAKTDRAPLFEKHPRLAFLIKFHGEPVSANLGGQTGGRTIASNIIKITISSRVPLSCEMPHITKRVPADKMTVGALKMILKRKYKKRKNFPKK